MRWPRAPSTTCSAFPALAHCAEKPVVEYGSLVLLISTRLGRSGWVGSTHEHIQRYVLLFQSLPEVLDVVRVTGEDCFVVRCAFGQPADLERVVDALAAFGSVSTSLVLSHPVNKAVPLG